MLIAIGLAMTLTASPELNSAPASGRWLLFGAFLLGAVATVAIDVLIKQKRIDMISSVYFGLLVGLFLTYIVNLATCAVIRVANQFPIWQNSNFS